jgi:pimeloyl-ACP methyl ester carboxylesterase
MRCCAGDEGFVALRSRPAEEGFKPPTIVLVHGAFADASSWNAVIAPANPLRGVTADSAYTASLLNHIDGPVLLAGHSNSDS